jgi:Periplasmic copper-binding protein (NosD)/Domain of unknown function DUF11
MGDGTSRGGRRCGIGAGLSGGLVAAAVALGTTSLGVAVTAVDAATVPAGADAVIHVSTTGHDTASCGSVTDPCETIPYAYGRAADGDTIQVAAGTYTLAGPLRIAKPGIRLLGAMAGVDATTRTPGGPGETVVTGSAGPPTLGLFSAMADDVTIDGFTLTGNLAGGGAATSEHFSGYVVEDNIVSGNITGLYPESDGSKPSVFKDNFFTDDNDSGPNSGNGIFTFRPLANALFTGNKFRDNNNAPINIAGGEVPGGSHDITIADNDMDGEFGVTLVAVSHVLITRNKMSGGWNAVQVSGACHDITITRNTMNDKTRGGVLLFTGFAAATNTGITIEDNTINHTATVEGRYGIEVSRSNDVVIRRNFLEDSGHGAIGFTTRGQDVPSAAATIEQNTITGSGGPGISAAPGSYTGPMAVHFNRIVDNDPHQGIVNDDPAATIDARDSWWGCNSMPDGAGCDHPAGTAAAAVGYHPWLVLKIRSVPADILAGQAAAIYADLRYDSAGALRAGPFFAPVYVRFSTTRGHVALSETLTSADLSAHTEWPSGQPRPERICVQVDNQEACLHFAAHPEVSLHATMTAVPNPAHAGRRATFTIPITNGGPADAFGVIVDDGLAPVLADFTWTCTATAPPSRCSRASGRGSIAATSADIAAGGTITYRLTGVISANATGYIHNTVRIIPPPGVTDHGCSPKCSASATVSLSPVVPVTG